MAKARQRLDSLRGPRAGGVLLLLLFSLRGKHDNLLPVDAFQPSLSSCRREQPFLRRGYGRLSSQSELRPSTEYNFLSENFEEDKIAAAENKDCNDPVLDFVEIIETTPVGSLPVKEAGLLRETMRSIAKEAYSKGNDARVPEVVEHLLFRMVDEWQVTKASAIEPTADDFVTAMESWESAIGIDPQKRNTQLLPTAVDHVWSLFKALEDLYYNESTLPSLKPNADVFRIVLRVLASSRQHDIDRKAWLVFQDMAKVYNIAPDAGMYESMIFMLAKSHKRGAAKRAENLLREAIEWYPPSDEKIGISIDSFNVVLTAWAKSRLDYGPERAEKLMFLMDEVGMKPNVSSFTSLLDAYAQKTDWESVSQSERIFNRVLDLYLQGDETFEPSIVSWTVVMSAWSRLASKNFKGAGEKADRLLRRMEKLYSDDRIGFGPDSIVYVTALNANAFTKTANGLLRAAVILDEMNERYMDGDDSFKPTARSIRILFDSYSQSMLPDKMNQLEDILDRYSDHLESLRSPNASTDVLDDIKYIHRSMILGYCESQEPDLAQKYLKDIVDKGMEVESICFDKIIDANTQANDSGSIKRSYEVFELLERCRLKGVVKSNERAYSSFIRAMTKAHVPDLANKSHALLKRMHVLFEDGNQEMKPTVFTYNAALMACSQSGSVNGDEKSKADFKTAVSIFNELRSGTEEPDHTSFGNMFRCSNLLPEGLQKDALITSFFRLCCEKGLINQFVLRDLRLCASGELWESLLGCSADEDEVDLALLPSSWSRNAYKKPKSKSKFPPNKRRQFRRR